MKKYLLIFLGVCMSMLSFAQTKTTTTSSTKGHSSAPKEEKPTEVNIYIDNTGSMWGFFNKGNDFDFALSSVLTQMQLNNFVVDTNIHIYFINGKVIEYTGKNIIGDCKDKKFFSKGKVGTTEISGFFNETLKKSGCNVLNIVISDFMISPGKGGDAKTVVAQEKNAISLAVKGALNRQKNLAISMYRLTSIFNGNIYNCVDEPKKIVNEQIPYYMWVAADQNLLKKFRRCVPVSKIENSKGGKSVTHNYVFFNANTKNAPSKVIIKSTSEGKQTGPNVVEKAKLNQSGFYRVKIAVDLKQFSLLGKKYLTNKENYQVSNKSYKIISIDEKTGTGTTHEILLETKSKVTPSAITVSLRDRFPKWISEVNIQTDDCESIFLETSKTYGILTIAEAVKNAYGQKSIWEDFKFYINSTPTSRQ